MQNRNFLKVVQVGVTALILLFFGYLIPFLQIDKSDQIEADVLKKVNEELTMELNDLKKSVELDYSSYDYNLERVKSKDLYGVMGRIVITNKDGMVGDLVVGDKGLIGVISEVDNNIAYVATVDSNYNIQVRIGESYGNLVNGYIELIDKFSDVKEGDLVYTSGLLGEVDTVYVGNVVEVKEDKSGLGKKAKVSLVENSNSRYVSVLKGVR